MKVFRADKYRAYVQGSRLRGVETPAWVHEADGLDVMRISHLILGAWCEEVCDVTREEDVQGMITWLIGTEHIVRIDGEDIPIIVEKHDFKQDCVNCIFYGRKDICVDGQVARTCCRIVGRPPVVYRRKERGMYWKDGTWCIDVPKGCTLDMTEILSTFAEVNKSCDLEKAEDLQEVRTWRKGTVHKVLFQGTEYDMIVTDTWVNPLFTFGDLNKRMEIKITKDTKDKLLITVTESIYDSRPLWIVNMEEHKGWLGTGVFLSGRTKVEPNIKEVKMIDKNFTFTKKTEKGVLCEPKVCKTAKDYEQGCEHCGADIYKGTYALTSEEKLYNKYNVYKTIPHRLCAECTAEYIKAKSCGEAVKELPFKVGDIVRVHNMGIPMYGHIGRVMKAYYTDDIFNMKVNFFGTGKELSYAGNMDRYFELGEEPKKEPSYAERQAQWVEYNNIKVGDKVRITKHFSANEDGSSCHKGSLENQYKASLVGASVRIKEIRPECLIVNEKDGGIGGWFVPFTACEPVKYRKFNKEEMNKLVGKVLTLKSEKTNHIVTSLHSDSTVHVAGAGTYGAKELWSYFTLDGQPCAVEE